MAGKLEVDNFARPRVDVVVPFVGSELQLAELCERLNALELRQGDSLTVVDNRAHGREGRSTCTAAQIIAARDLQSSYYARNRGAECRHAEWIAFIDADVEPSAALLDSYFVPPPDERTAVLAGGVVDKHVEDGTPAARYAHLRRSMSQANTLASDRWGYAQTANCAVRRAAFDEVGGFCGAIRSGGDADLCFRLKATGWEIEARSQALVVHRSRRTIRQLLRQRARHGSGSAWLNRRYPGAFPRARWSGLVVWSVKSALVALVAAARGDRDRVIVRTLEPLGTWAFELGRLVPNEPRGRPR